MELVASKDLLKARQIAKRNRAAKACAPCKTAKSKCSDYQPCKRCSKFGFKCVVVKMNEQNVNKPKAVPQAANASETFPRNNLAFDRIPYFLMSSRDETSAEIGNNGTRDAQDISRLIQSRFDTFQLATCSNILPPLNLSSLLHTNQYDTRTLPALPCLSLH